MCLPKACCYCIRLKNGVFSIAILSMIGAAVLFSGFVAVFYFKLITGPQFGISVASLLIDILASSFLLHGVTQESVGAVQTYIAIQALHLVLLVVAGVFLVAMVSAGWVDPHRLVQVLQITSDIAANKTLTYVITLLPIVAVIGFLSYFWVVVLSYSKHLKNKKEYEDMDLPTTVEIIDP